MANLQGFPFAITPAYASDVAKRYVSEGKKVIRVLGSDAPYELIRAAGLSPVRLVADDNLPTPDADALVGTANMSQSGRSLLQQIFDDKDALPLLLTHCDYETPQLFATLRQLFKDEELPARHIHFYDHLHQMRESSAKYNLTRAAQLHTWLADMSAISGNKASAEKLTFDIEIQEQQRTMLAELLKKRNDFTPRISGRQFHHCVAATMVYTPHEWCERAASLLADIELDRAAELVDKTKERIIIAGLPQLNDRGYRELEAAGIHIVGDWQDWGDKRVARPVVSDDWQNVIADPARACPDYLIPALTRAQFIAGQISAVKASGVIYLTAKGDEASKWDAGFISGYLSQHGIDTGIWETGSPFPGTLVLFAGKHQSRAVSAGEAAAKAMSSPRKPRPKPERSKKALASVADFGTYQREWFQSVRSSAEEGAQFGVVNANSPQEMLRAMGLPFVVNQWWASIVAAKQQSKRYASLLKANKYPGNVEAYSAQGIAAYFDKDTEQAPWGGLPEPQFLQTVLGSDATPRIFDHWARETGANLFMFERTVECRIDLYEDWWNKLPGDWKTELEPERVALLTSELKDAITALEAHTGETFDMPAFTRIMSLVNEQEEYYRKTRDLLASTCPVPVSVVDTMPATMVPQWHRGTEWARDAAKAFYEEVKAKVEQGESVCGNEKLRLMWVGRGLWSNMQFYQRWQESHGAVFVWSMYLALAADGYIREFSGEDDALEALAARFVTMGDELRMPTWAGAWHVKEARTHHINGAVALSDADPFVLRALRKAGIPVLSLPLDNFDSNHGPDSFDDEISAFLASL
ncbi:2-hydroxyacyl-CoA dehydratase [Alteromonas sp. NFXS44]|uniref:2-hydroxyacyl-CoA dehydratase family protein n=1 Tax=Alteromonas sp. NFXS44 TaxID=2818435 RepID=UPI0032DF6FF5